MKKLKAFFIVGVFTAAALMVTSCFAPYPMQPGGYYGGNCQPNYGWNNGGYRPWNGGWNRPNYGWNNGGGYYNQGPQRRPPQWQQNNCGQGPWLRW